MVCRLILPVGEFLSEKIDTFYLPANTRTCYAVQLVSINRACPVNYFKFTLVFFFIKALPKEIHKGRKFGRSLEGR
jgi:hypothetical protein